MAVKTITITEDAYEAVKRLKDESESFSELFKRLAGRKLKIKDAVGLWKGKIDVEAYKERVLEIHTKMGKDMEERRVRRR